MLQAETWEFDAYSFDYASRFIFKFTRTACEFARTWQDLAEHMKSETQSEFWRHQRDRHRDLTSWGTMGFDISIVRRDHGRSALWVKASLSPSIVHSLLNF